MQTTTKYKFFGGSALKGTAAQKKWAETIREQKLTEMSMDDAIIVCDPQGLLTHSKFWIENRDKTGRQIAEFVASQKAMLAEFKALEKGTPEAFAMAAKYNALTAQWGFQ